MLYSIAHVVVYAVARVFFRLQVIGRENVPVSGGVIVAANHNSYFDIPLLGCALPREASYLAKAELFRIPLFSSFLKVMGGIPIRRGGVGREAISETLYRLRAGRLVVIYPEGARSSTGKIQPPKPGLGKIVSESNVAVVPAYIQGCASLRLFRKVTIIFGRPLHFQSLEVEPGRGSIRAQSHYATIARSVMSEVARLGQEGAGAG